MDHFLCGLDSTQNTWYGPRPVTNAHEFAIGNSSFQLIPISTSASLNAGIHGAGEPAEFCSSNSASDSNSTNPNPNLNSAFKPVHELKIKSEGGAVAKDDDRQEGVPPAPPVALTPLSTNKSHSHKSKSGERWDTKKVCNICGKILSRGDKLKNHIRTHSNTYPYHCDSCGQGFLRSEGLRVHTRIHTGERPYVCVLCGKAYTRKDKLTRHAVIHTGERPFVCQHCGKSFTRKDKMQRHELIHRVDKPFTCSPCNLEFVRQETLNMHMEKKHPERLPYTLVQQPRLNNPSFQPDESILNSLIDSKSGILKDGKATNSVTPPVTNAVVNGTIATDTIQVTAHSSLPSSVPLPHYSAVSVPSTTASVGAPLLSSAPIHAISHLSNGYSIGLPFSHTPSVPVGSVSHATQT